MTEVSLSQLSCTVWSAVCCHGNHKETDFSLGKSTDSRVWSEKVRLKDHICHLCYYAARFNVVFAHFYVWWWYWFSFHSGDVSVFSPEWLTGCAYVCGRTVSCSHSSPALTYLRLHEAKTAPRISLSQHVYSQRSSDCVHVSIESTLQHPHGWKWLGAPYTVLLPCSISNKPRVAKKPLNSAASQCNQHALRIYKAF